MWPRTAVAVWRAKSGLRRTGGKLSGADTKAEETVWKAKTKAMTNAPVVATRLRAST